MRSARAHDGVQGAQGMRPSWGRWGKFRARTEVGGACGDVCGCASQDGQGGVCVVRAAVAGAQHLWIIHSIVGRLLARLLAAVRSARALCTSLAGDSKVRVLSQRLGLG